jgi:predicted ester cyclase
MKPSTPLAAYQKFLEEFCNGRFELADELVSADFLIHVAGGASMAMLGPDGLRALLRGARSPFSSLIFRIDVGPLVQGDLVAARWWADGIYAGGFPGAKAPAGTPVHFGGHDFLRFRDGRFVEYWGGADDGHVMSQLGMLP